MITDQEHAELVEFSRAIGRAENSGRQPRCVLRTFASRKSGEVVLTMQGWVDLEAVDSPLLGGELPETMEELMAAADAFGLSVEKLNPKAAALVAMGMLEEVNNAMGMVLPMKPPSGSAELASKSGFGTWLPIYTELVSQLNLSPENALKLGVGRAFAMLAANRFNRGWEVDGTS